MMRVAAVWVVRALAVTAAAIGVGALILAAAWVLVALARVLGFT